MATENIDLRHLAGSTATLAAITTKNDRWLYDTTKDHAVAYKTDGSTLRHFLMGDSSNNLINAMGNMIIGDGSYFGLGPAKGRLQFDDEGTDTITVKSASLLLGGVLGSDGDPNTYISMLDADRISYLAGGVTFLDMINTIQDLFEVNPNQADIDFTVNSNGLEALFLDGATGAVTLGSTLQATKIGIGKAAGTYELDLQALANSTGQRMYCYSDNVAHSPFIATYKSHADTATNVETIDTETLFQLRIRGVDSGTNLDMGAAIEVYQNGAAGAKVPCDMKFYTSTSSATNEVMRLDKDGLVSCLASLAVTGQTSTDKLHVGGTSDPGDNNAIIDGTLSAARIGIGVTPHATIPLYMVGATAFSTDYDGYRDEFIYNLIATGGINNIGGSIGLSGPGRGYAFGVMAAEQGTADIDQVGLSFYTHPSATTTDPIVKKMTLDYNGVLSIVSKTLKLGASTSVDGDWQWIESGGNLLCQKMESSAWVTKATIVA